VLRPRQARYQAALRPDIVVFILAYLEVVATAQGTKVRLLRGMVVNYFAVSSLVAGGSLGPRSASIIPTIGNVSVLDTTDRMPTPNACFSNSGLACCVNRMIGIAGAISKIRRAVSIPFIPGI
jgi:hypothetical protein